VFLKVFDVSQGVTNSQAPPVSSASWRSKLSAGALPTPMANRRWPGWQQ